MTPELTDRRAYQTWETDPNKNDIRKRACAKIEKLLRQYNYTKGLEHEEALDKIIAKYEKLHK